MRTCAHTPTGGVASGTAASVGFEEMRSFGNLRIHPLLQSHWRESIAAVADGFAVSFKGRRIAVHQFEHGTSTRSDVSDGGRTQSALRRGGDDALIDLNRGEPRVERVTFSRESANLLFEIG